MNDMLMEWTHNIILLVYKLTTNRAWFLPCPLIDCMGRTMINCSAQAHCEQSRCNDMLKRALVTIGMLFSTLAQQL